MPLTKCPKCLGLYELEFGCPCYKDKLTPEQRVFLQNVILGKLYKKWDNLDADLKAKEPRTRGVFKRKEKGIITDSPITQ
jgi:hypothetical protein